MTRFLESDNKIFSDLCEEAFGESPLGHELLPAAGGDRTYVRLFLPGRTVLGVVADSLRDAEAYVRLTRAFLSSREAHEGKFHVPEVYAATPDYSHYIVEDIGSVSLADRLGSDGIAALVSATLEALVSMQTLSPEVYEKEVGYAPLEHRQVMWDLNYFKYEFLKPAGVDFDESLLEDDFERMASNIFAVPSGQWGFMMRDCQSRNVMLAGKEGMQPYFIDFQGGRRGPLLYDAVSLLWQSKASFSEEFRSEMISLYCRRLAEARGIEVASIRRHLPLIVLFRTLQVLGAYGFRGLVQKRAHFIVSIPGALANLRTSLSDGTLTDYPELERVARRLVDLSRFEPAPAEGCLEVKVFSFSYKNGYPEDLTGNGGGFMFDCRGMHNPGRYEEYKPLTGRDLPVIEFLRQQGEADKFAAGAVELVAPTVSRYLKRGFSSLQIGFGCTGGRHRSVYCAEAAAHALALRFPEAKIRLIHREQGINESFN